MYAPSSGRAYPNVEAVSMPRYSAWAMHEASSGPVDEHVVSRRSATPGLLPPPPLRPRLHLVSAPHSAAGVLGERSGEAWFTGDLVGALLAHSEELGELDEADGGRSSRHGLVSRSLAMGAYLLVRALEGSRRACELMLRVDCL
jgi:hypothetical protein